MIEPRIKPWVPECDYCPRPATYDVRNHRDWSLGHFCEEHAKERLQIELDKLKEYPPTGPGDPNG